MESYHCNPERKRAVESIANAYYSQYGLPISSGRIAHWYGLGIKRDNDGCMIAGFIGDAVLHRNIVLNSDATTIRSFIYLSDTILGLICTLLNGKPGEAYNRSNKFEQVMVRDLAELICSLSPSNIKVEFAKENDKKTGYCNYNRVELDNSKIEGLGFTPQINLREGVNRTLESFSR